MVDHVVIEAVKRRKAALATGSTDPSTDLVGSVKAGLTAAARRAGLRLDEQATEVLIVPRGVQVSVKWSVPAVNFQGETYLSIPMSFSGTFSGNGALDQRARCLL